MAGRGHNRFQSESNALTQGPEMLFQLFPRGEESYLYMTISTPIQKRVAWLTLHERGSRG